MEERSLTMTCIGAYENLRYDLDDRIFSDADRLNLFKILLDAEAYQNVKDVYFILVTYYINAESELLSRPVTRVIGVSQTRVVSSI